MSVRTICAWLFVMALVVGSNPREARGQEWSVDLSAGRIVYDAVAVNVGTNNVVGTVRYDARRDTWVYGSGAAPLREGDPRWAAAGAGGRVVPRGLEGRRVTVGAELGAHAFLFRDAIVEQTGNGGTLEAIPFTMLSTGPGHIELRGGWRGQTLAFAGATQHRGVFETGARVRYETVLRAQVDMRWVHATEGAFPFFGASLLYDGSPLQLSAQAGRWLSDQLDDMAWGAGASVSLGTQTSVWASVRQDAPDPLYWNSPRRTWSVGVTRRLGRAPAVILPAPRAQAGGVVIRVPVADAPARGLSIAGSFNDWKPLLMQREGGEWVIRLPLAAGLYQYAFRSDTGEWFVPASIPGRRDDGMGGHVAVLMVL